ncbi:hypothetical protein M885DRAFT_482063 [Pelagophyceae sp. CCMP2097]|nr:hypothetical protein M885DRAFT_482063 [Pelagophyceae sp. CCMP2097]
MASADELKAQGNALYTAGDAAGAIRLYTSALDAMAERSGPAAATLLSNRAACTRPRHLKLGAHTACVADCDSALALDGSNAKALYRRATAREALGDVEAAFRDLKLCVTYEPKNAAAISAARRLKEALTRKCEARGAFDSPAQQIALQIATALEIGENGVDWKPDAEEPSKNKMTAVDLFKAAAARAANDEADAAVMWRRGAVAFALRAANAPRLRKDERKGDGPKGDARDAALRLVSAVAMHHEAWFAEQPAALEAVAALLVARGAEFLERGDVQITVLALAARVADAADARDVAAASGARAAAPAVATAAVTTVLRLALRHARPDVRDGALDVLVRWLAPDDALVTKGKTKGLKGFLEAARPDFKEQKRSREAATESAEMRRLVRSQRLDAALVALDASSDDGADVAAAWWALLDSRHDAERRKAHAAVARVMRAVAARGDANDPDLVWASGPKAFAEALLQAGKSEAALAYPAYGISNESAGEWSGALATRRRCAGMVAACHLGCAEFAADALALCFDGGNIFEVMQLLSTRDALAEALAAEALGCLASTDAGRASLAPLVEANLLEKLMVDGATAAVRSAAASAVAKLGLAAKALRAGATETGRLLDAAVALLRDATGGGDASAEAACAERAVEVLAAMSTDSAVKEELTHGSGRCGEALSDLCRLAKAAEPGAPVAYGLATVFANLTVTNDELRRRHFHDREMEITPEQYDELQRVTKQKADDDADDDTLELAAARCRKFVVADGVVALAHLASARPSVETAQKLAEVLSMLAKDEAVRGTLVQQGGFKACVALASVGPSAATGHALDDGAAPAAFTVACRRHAAHAAAKILVTTNPNQLTDAQRLVAIRPLLWLCKEHGAQDLMHFEALLALTNLLSLGAVPRQRVASEAGGIRTIEYLQFSDNDMVQRAATEALTNMVPNEAFLAHLQKPDKMKLWLALAGDVGRDAACARAAVGCLAMASSDEGVALALARGDGAVKLAEVIDAGEPSLAHRAAFAVANVARDAGARALFLEGRDALLSALKSAAERHAGDANAALPLALADAVEAINTEPPPASADD